MSLLLCLLRAALLQIPPDTTLFVDVDEDLWKKTMNLAARHSVFALAFDGAMLLPKEVQPSRMLQLLWIVQVDKIEKKYAYKLSVLHQMEKLFAENNIKMLAFKGFSLAKCYPIPEHREFGDLDIYLFGKTKQGNQLLLENGAKQDSWYYKHICVIFKNVMIENHAFFLNIHDSKKAKAADKILRKIIADSDDVQIWDEFPIEFQALFYMFHAIHHFSYDVFSLRLITDLAAFWKTNIDKIDIENYRQTLKSVGLLKQADALTSLTVNLLQIDTKYVPPFEIDRQFEEKILYYMFHHYIPPENDKRGISALKVEWDRIFYRAKSYELIYSQKTYKLFILSIISNLKNISFFRFCLKFIQKFHY
ncbi:MAG: nucleotidyltransferase family protein [Paludibacter sp.]|nr:nucleotidyltransferase family protein [Paludibacter sp.]